MSTNHEQTLAAEHSGNHIQSDTKKTELVGAAAIRGINVFPAEQPPKKQQTKVLQRFGVNPLDHFIRVDSPNSMD